jgi:multiple sugar transport system substrate-binding protein
MADTATSPVPVSVETRGDGGAPRLCACAGSLAWRGWLLIVGALMFFVGACAEEASQSETVLRVANWGGIAVEGDFMRLEREFREEFERKHGVRVQFEQIPGFGQYAPKVLMMHVTGSMPDVVTLDASSAAVFIDNDVLRDLRPFIESDATFELGEYFENVVNIARRGAALYAIPLDFTPMVMYYNKRLFDAAGVPYPQPGWTWNDFFDAASRLTIFADDGRAGPVQFGFNFENAAPLWMPLLWTNGGDVLDPTGQRASGYLDGAKSIEALQFLVDLLEKYEYGLHPKRRAAAGMDPFRAGKAGMDMKGHWMMIDYRADGLDFGVVGLPTNGVERVTVIYEAGLAIAQRAEHPELAWEYIKHMTSADVQRRRVASGLAISGNRRAAAHFAGNPVEDAFLEEVKYARPPWGAMVDCYPFIEGLLKEMMEDILYSDGKLSVEQAARETAKLIDAALADQ